MRLPGPIRLIILASAAMQFVFGVTLLLDPGRIGDLWPWPLPPLLARLLGASTLVSIPLALLSIGINRFAVAMIPLVMMLAYRVIQLLAGLIHADRFAPDSLVTLNYFGGGLLMAAAFGYPLWAGLGGRLPPAGAGPMARPLVWRPAPGFRAALTLVAAFYGVLGAAFLVFGRHAALLWFDAGGLTPLTARLFASPLIGLGLGLFLCARAEDWRAVMVPAAAMATIGILGSLSLWLDRATFAPATPMALVVAATPPFLLLVGAALLAARPSPTPLASGGELSPR